MTEARYRLYRVDDGEALYDDAVYESPYGIQDVGESLEARLGPKIQEDNWNERFQAANELPTSSEIKNIELNQVCADFVSTARTYAECIIREHFIPSQMRVLSTADVGGIAGGVKFKFRGILFKLCEDKCIGNGYIYGGKIHDYELAAKAAGHELRATCIAFHGCQTTQSQDSLPLTTTMMCLIDYLGWRLTAMPVLPLGDNSLRYGSDNGGSSYQVAPQFHSRIGRLANELHLAAHKVKSPSDVVLHTAGDVEGHHGTDNRAYLLDLARLFPPEAPAARIPSGHHIPNRGQSIFYRLLRPELLLQLKATGQRALSGDAWSLWSSHSDAALHEANALSATQYLLQDIIPNFAKKVDETPSLLKTSISAVLHRHGINLRHLGLLRSLVQQDEVRGILFIEILARTLKQLLRKLLRESSMAKASDTALRADIAHFLNVLSLQPEIWAKISAELVLRFGQVSLLNQERTPDGFRLAGERILAPVFKKLFVMTGITLVDSEMDEVGIGFQFTSEDFVLGMRVKHFDVMDWSSGAWLFEQASSRSYLPRASRLRLYQLSARKFAACVATSSNNVEAEVRAVVAAIRVTTSAQQADDILLEGLKAVDWVPEAKQQLLQEASKIWTVRPPSYPHAWNYFRDHSQTSSLIEIRIDIFSLSNLFKQVNSDEEKSQLLKVARWDCVDEDGKTALHKACEMGVLQAVRDHLAHGANPNVQDPKGDTPLHGCFSANHLELVRILLEAGADPGVRNIWRSTPLEMAPFHFPFHKLGISCPSTWSSRRPFIHCTDKIVLLGFFTIGALYGANYFYWTEPIIHEPNCQFYSYCRWNYLNFLVSTGLIWAVFGLFALLFHRFWHSLPYPCNKRAKLLRIQANHVYLILLILGAMLPLLEPSNAIVRSVFFAVTVICAGFTWPYEREIAFCVTLFGLIAIAALTLVQLDQRWSPWFQLKLLYPISSFCFAEMNFPLSSLIPYKEYFSKTVRKQNVILLICFFSAYIIAAFTTTVWAAPGLLFFLSSPLFQWMQFNNGGHCLQLRSSCRLARLGRWQYEHRILVEPNVWKGEQIIEPLDQGRARLRELVSEWQTRPLTPCDWILFKKWKQLPELEHVQLDIFSVSEYELSIFDLFPEDREEMLLRAEPGITNLEGRTPLILAMEFHLDGAAKLLRERSPEQCNVKDIYGCTPDDYLSSKWIKEMNMGFSWVRITLLIPPIIYLLPNIQYTSRDSTIEILLIFAPHVLILLVQYLGMFFTSKGYLSLKTAQLMDGGVILLILAALFCAVFIDFQSEYFYYNPSSNFTVILLSNFIHLWIWVWTWEDDLVGAFDLKTSLRWRDFVVFFLVCLSIAMSVTFLTPLSSIVRAPSILMITGTALVLQVLHILWWVLRYPKINFTPWPSWTDKGPFQILSQEEFIHLVECRAKYLLELRRSWLGSSQAPETPLILSALKWLAQRQLIERYPLCVRFASPGLLEILKVNLPIGTHDSNQTQHNQVQSPLLVSNFQTQFIIQ